uniref:Exostosin domain-containing protein n=1 Tax=Macrostomum lignano TaxID=282301 RepID=A0A1I8HRH5_9PLAT
IVSSQLDSAAAAEAAVVAAVASPPRRRRPRPAIRGGCWGSKPQLRAPAADSADVGQIWWQRRGNCVRPETRAEKAVCRLKHDRLVCLDGRDFAPGCSLEQVQRLVPRDQLATWRAAIASPPPQDLVLLLVLAWHRGASERLARDPGSCAAALCSVLSEAAKSSSTSSGQVPQPFRYLVSGLQGLAA